MSNLSAAAGITSLPWWFQFAVSVGVFSIVLKTVVDVARAYYVRRREEKNLRRIAITWITWLQAHYEQTIHRLEPHDGDTNPAADELGVNTKITTVSDHYALTMDDVVARYSFLEADELTTLLNLVLAHALAQDSLRALNHKPEAAAVLPERKALVQHCRQQLAGVSALAHTAKTALSKA